MRKALKSAVERMRAFTRFPRGPASFLRQKAEDWQYRARQWQAARHAAERDRQEAAESTAWFWEPLAPRSAAPDAAGDAAQTPTPGYSETPQMAAHIEPSASIADALPDAPAPPPPAQPAPAWRHRIAAWRERAVPRQAGSAPAAEQPTAPGWSERISGWREGFATTPAPPAPPVEQPAESVWRDRSLDRPEALPIWQRALRLVAIALLVFLALPYALILVYRVIDPPFSALMARQWLTGTSIRHQWVDFEDISPALPQAVVISEDAAFCRHWGVDWNAVGEALEDAEDGNGVRGASTIPMQTAKNLFLWNGASYVRKALELPQAYWMSAVWPKRRVLEIYLNIAEWGPGIFGAEAAARHHFRKSASELTAREAALLAAALPSPLKRNAGRPSGQTARIAARIGARVAREAQDASCVFPRGR